MTRREQEKPQTIVLRKDGNKSLNPKDWEYFQESLYVMNERAEAQEAIRKLQRLLEMEGSLGLTTDHVSASKRVLKQIEGRPHLAYLEPEEFMDLSQAFEKEGNYARVNWKERRSKVATMIWLLTGTSARVTVAALSVFVASLAFRIAAEYKWNTYDSPEAQAAILLIDRERAATIKTEEETKLRQTLIGEMNSSLGLEPTIASGYNWRFNYLGHTPSQDYEPVDGKDTSGFFRNGTGIVLDQDPSESSKFSPSINTNLSVLADTHKRSDGKLVPKLRIMKGHDVQSEVLLRIDSTAEIDARVVHAFDSDAKRERWFRINVSPNGEGLEVTMMRPIGGKR